MKKIIFFICMSVSIINGLGINNTISSDFQKIEDKSIVMDTVGRTNINIEDIIDNESSELKDSSFYVLSRNFGYYKGSLY
ncbi:MAG: hypothetical protein IJZ89_01685 [Clostridia bacterium]|nr:hypothetical protein [Clostridia bacterium]